MHSFVVIFEPVVAVVVYVVVSVLAGGVFAVVEGLSSLAVLLTYFPFIFL